MGKGLATHISVDGSDVGCRISRDRSGQNEYRSPFVSIVLGMNALRALGVASHRGLCTWGIWDLGLGSRLLGDRNKYYEYYMDYALRTVFSERNIYVRRRGPVMDRRASPTVLGANAGLVSFE